MVLGVFAFGIEPPGRIGDGELSIRDAREMRRIQEEVSNALEINQYQRSYLFISNPYHAAGDFTHLPTFDEAITTLETLRDKGKVEWPERRPLTR